jgi:hypothetical protein
MNRFYGYLTILIIFFDLVSSFFIFYQTPLLGDIANIVLPSEGCKNILTDPLGYKAMFLGETYSGPNRFFAHWFTYNYFNSVPLFLQYLFSPINSIYISVAVIKLFTQISISFLLTNWITGSFNFRSINFLKIFSIISACFLSAPHGYFFPLRITDQSVVYTVFYSFSFLFVLIYLHPFVSILFGRRTNKLYPHEHFILILISFLVVFNGPVNAPSIVLISTVIYLAFILNLFSINKKLNNTILFHFAWVSLLSFYSIYLGTFNSENPTELPNLFLRYNNLVNGIVKTFFLEHHSPLLIITFVLAGLVYLRNKYPKSIHEELFISVQFVVFFSLMYTIILPLGGYRTYRDLIFRFDTMLPISICLIFLFGFTIHKFLIFLEGKSLKRMELLLTFSLFIVVFIDSLTLLETRNSCERNALKLISKANSEPVIVPECTIMSWDINYSPEKFRDQSMLFHRWNITEKPVRFYSKKKY